MPLNLINAARTLACSRAGIKQVASQHSTIFNSAVESTGKNPSLPGSRSETNEARDSKEQGLVTSGEGKTNYEL
jgi:hypothetical protein